MAGHGNSDSLLLTAVGRSGSRTTTARACNRTVQRQENEVSMAGARRIAGVQRVFRGAGVEAGELLTTDLRAVAVNGLMPCAVSSTELQLAPSKPVRGISLDSPTKSSCRSQLGQSQHLSLGKWQACSPAKARPAEAASSDPDGIASPRSGVARGQNAHRCPLAAGR